MDNKYKKGSYTVETALIMPVVLMVILVLFFFVLYMYNRGVLQNAASRGAKQCFYYENEKNERIEQACARVVLADIEDSLVGVKETDVKVQVEAMRVIITIEGQLNVPELLAPKGTVFEDLWEYQICVKEYRINPAEMILGAYQLEKIAESGETEMIEDGS